MADLFGRDDGPAARHPAPGAFEASAPRPLAETLRPRRLSEVVGQDHLLGPESPISRMVAAKRLSSFVLWGPPGTGKTTIARLVSAEAGIEFLQLSAVNAGIADLRKVIETARHVRNALGRQTAVFIDELHRFNRTTQDALLPHVEDGTVVLIGATTENPSFSLVSALLSRARVLVVNRLDRMSLGQLLDRAERHQGRQLPLDPDARDALIDMADGDARYLLNLAEDLLGLSGPDILDVAGLSRTVQKRAAVYDKAQEGHYNLLSCFHKTLRGSDVQAALYWAARMIAGGEDPATLFRRLACAASEDVGMADPQAMPQVLSAWDAFERVGWPEGRLFLAQAITYVATAPKSNAAYRAFDAALELANRTGSLPPPKHILNAPTKMMRELGYGAGYQYDHDFPEAYSGQEYFPEELTGAARPEFYRPNERGFERDIRKRLDFWEKARAQRRRD
ncbi:replication-associated recombination protein A [Aquibium sp. ELW1220]|jgi:putative ATPase|uniref:replication-associated recombination protein A n=1 Tax=Aquibium sp. ELW1220 TaxID=2976766 RepID=UPI0025AFC1AC|nr:replication-associated recombination protein A [Aquibium sp. ELW1220]MDN2580645.1 replication-associated recombination protein A [Aquibium sp. ELW1220]